MENHVLSKLAQREHISQRKHISQHMYIHTQNIHNYDYIIIYINKFLKPHVEILTAEVLNVMYTVLILSTITQRILKYMHTVLVFSTSTSTQRILKYMYTVLVFSTSTSTQRILKYMYTALGVDKTITFNIHVHSTCT